MDVQLTVVTSGRPCMCGLCTLWIRHLKIAELPKNCVKNIVECASIFDLWFWKRKLTQGWVNGEVLVTRILFLSSVFEKLILAIERYVSLNLLSSEVSSEVEHLKCLNRTHFLARFLCQCFLGSSRAISCIVSTYIGLNLFQSLAQYVSLSLAFLYAL